MKLSGYYLPGYYADNYAHINDYTPLISSCSGSCYLDLFVHQPVVVEEERQIPLLWQHRTSRGQTRNSSHSTNVVFTTIVPTCIKHPAEVGTWFFKRIFSSYLLHFLCTNTFLTVLNITSAQVMENFPALPLELT